MDRRSQERVLTLPSKLEACSCLGASYLRFCGLRRPCPVGWTHASTSSPFSCTFQAFEMLSLEPAMFEKHFWCVIDRSETFSVDHHSFVWVSASIPLREISLHQLRRRKLSCVLAHLVYSLHRSAPIRRAFRRRLVALRQNHCPRTCSPKTESAFRRTLELTLRTSFTVHLPLTLVLFARDAAGEHRRGGIQQCFQITEAFS